MKIRIEEHPNPERISFHLSKRVPNNSEDPNFIVSEMSFGDEKPGLKYAKQIMGMLFAIEGVNGVTIRPYEISIGKSPACDWKDIESDVIHVIKAMIAKKESVEFKPRKTMTDNEREQIHREMERYEDDFRWMGDM